MSLSDLERRLERECITVDVMHSDRQMKHRTRALDRFATGKVRVLVATDIAARGIDVSSVSHVINFDMPSTPEAYIHRIGRTGRAERSGQAYTLVTQEDRWADVSGQVSTNLVATYKALGGGWQIREGEEILSTENKTDMIERTSWGEFLDPEGLELPVDEKDRRDWQWPDW